jgi:indolepyruvate ferredoxin oxidoreductase beta subunit
VAFEKLEAVRFIDMLRPGGTVLINDYSIMPATVNAGTAVYPQDAALQAVMAQAGVTAVWVKGMEIADALGNTKAANVVLLGALSALLPKVAPETWDEVLALRIPPKYLELNRKAFQAGRAAVTLPDQAAG